MVSIRSANFDCFLFLFTKFTAVLETLQLILFHPNSLLSQRHSSANCHIFRSVALRETAVYPCSLVLSANTSPIAHPFRFRQESLAF